MIRTFLVVAVLAVAACSGGDDDTGSVTPPAATQAPSSPAAAPDADPYETYLANNPDPSLVLSREDAQTRAMLGCGTAWAPGTIDAVLADAYAGICG